MYMVAVSCVQDGDEIQNREDYAAACCAMQNVALAAWSEGIGMQWSTGPITLEDETYELLGVDREKEYIIGFFYTGYPEEVLDGVFLPVEIEMIITAGIHVVFAKVEAGQLAEGVVFLVEIPGQAARGGNDAVKLSAVAGG